MVESEPNNPNKRSGLYQGFIRFCKVTPFQGFPQLVDSLNWLEEIFWLIFILIFLALTFRDISQSVAQYVSQDTVSSTRVLSNETIRFANVTVCVEFFEDNYNFRNFSLNDSAFAKRFFRSQEAAAAFALLNVTPLFNDTVIRQKIDNATVVDFDSVEKLVILSAAMINNIVTLENKFWGFTRRRNSDEMDLYVPGNYTWGILQSSGILESTNDWTMQPWPNSTEAVFELYKFFMSKGVKFERLLPLIASGVCRFMKMWFGHMVPGSGYSGLTTNSYVYTEEVCRPENMLWLGALPFARFSNNNLCLRAPEGIFEFDRRIMPWALIGGPMTPSREYANRIPKFSFDFHGRRTVTSLCNDGENTLDENYEPRDKTWHEVQIHSHHRALSTGNTICATDDTVFECYGHCRAEFIRRHCGCWPLSWRYLKASPLNVPTCGYDLTTIAVSSEVPHFSNHSCIQALILGGMFAEIDNCSSKCVRPCDEIVYIVGKSGDYVPIYTYAYGHAFTVQKFSYVFVEETLKVTTDDLFTSLGGNLNLWIGGSFLAIFHLVVYALRHFFCRRAAPAEEGAATMMEQSLADILTAYVREQQLKAKRNKLSNASLSHLQKIQLVEAMRAYCHLVELEGQENADGQVKIATNV